MRLEPYRDAFTAPAWRFVPIPVMGALPAPGRRTVTACLRIAGRAMAGNFASCHQALNRARWNPRDPAKQPARQSVARPAAQGEPIVIGLDGTIGRRRGARIRARGICRGPARSSRGRFVRTSGLRRLSFMPLTPLPRLPGIKALPVLTVLAPSERWAGRKGRRHRPLTDRARQGMLRIIRRFPERAAIFVGDSSSGTRGPAHAIARHATLISRPRPDAGLFAPPGPRTPGQRGRPRQKGRPRPRLRTRPDGPATRWTPITLPRRYGGVKDRTPGILSETALWHRPGTPPKAIRRVLARDPVGQQGPHAFFSTDPDMDPAETIAVFARRWQVEATFQDARARLGVETQRQRSDDAIERTAPALLGMYGPVCLRAGEFLAKTPHPYRAAWHWKSSFTFSDAIAAARAQLWLDCILQRSASDRKRQKILPFSPDSYDGDSSFPEYAVKNVPPERIQRMVEALCFAA